MRLWSIVVGAAIGTVAAVVAWAPTAFTTLPQSWPEWANIIDPPTLAVAGVALYVGLAIVLVTGSVAIDICRARLRIDRLAPSTRSDWLAAFEGTELAHLAPRLLDLAPASTTEGLVLRSEFNAGVVRRELLHHYWYWLSRVHAFTGLALLLLGVVVGLAQRSGDISAIPAAIPVGTALATASALVILGVSGILAVASVAERLVNAITRLSLARLEGPMNIDGTGSALFVTPAAAERLVAALEQSRASLHEATSRLSRAAELLAATAQALAKRPAEAQGFTELTSAIEQLTAVVARGPEQRPVALAIASEPGMHHARLSKELRRLLADLEREEQQIER